MKLFPYDKFKINSPQSPTEVLLRIEECTGEKKLFNFDTTKEFSGLVTENGFEITKNISYRNSFLPVIEGKIEPSAVGSSVTVSMRLNALVLCFMLLWFSGVGMGCIAALSKLDNFAASKLIPFGMLAFGIALMSGGFWFEASKQKVRLIELISNK